MATATRTPRIRLILQLLAPGQWVNAREIADIGGAEYWVYIEELRAQGHVITQKFEYHHANRGQRLCWFRLEMSARFSAARSGLEHEVSVED